DVIPVVRLILDIPAKPVIIPDAVIRRIAGFVSRPLRQRGFLKLITQRCIVGMAVAVFPIHGQLIVKIFSVINPDGSRIGEPVAVPATAAETPSEAAAPTHPAGPSTADVKIKKAGIYIIE